MEQIPTQESPYSIPEKILEKLLKADIPPIPDETYKSYQQRWIDTKPFAVKDLVEYAINLGDRLPLAETPLIVVHENEKPQGTFKRAATRLYEYIFKPARKLQQTT